MCPLLQVSVPAQLLTDKIIVKLHNLAANLMSAIGCDFNRSMQHLISNHGEEDVADEDKGSFGLLVLELLYSLHVLMQSLIEDYGLRYFCVIRRIL